MNKNILKIKWIYETECKKHGKRLFQNEPYETEDTDKTEKQRSTICQKCKRMSLYNKMQKPWKRETLV